MVTSVTHGVSCWPYGYAFLSGKNYVNIISKITLCWKSQLRKILSWESCVCVRVCWQRLQIRISGSPWYLNHKGKWLWTRKGVCSRRTPLNKLKLLCFFLKMTEGEPLLQNQLACWFQSRVYSSLPPSLISDCTCPSLSFTDWVTSELVRIATSVTSKCLEL